MIISCANIDLNENIFEVLKRHRKTNSKNFNVLIARYNKENLGVTTYSTKNSISYEFNKRYNEVIREYNKMRGYLRFKEVFPEMILLSRTVEFEHRIGDLIANHFAKRYPRFCVIIACNNKAYISTCRKDLSFKYKKYKKYRVWFVKFNHFEEFISEFRKKVQVQVAERIELSDFSEKDFNESYYDIQYIQERKNLPHALRMMPWKYQKKANLKHEQTLFLKEKMNTPKKSVIDCLPTTKLNSKKKYK